jgi:hypothetical protein
LKELPNKKPNFYPPLPHFKSLSKSPPLITVNFLKLFLQPPAPLRHGQQRPGRPPFRTQLSEPNWTGPLGPSPVSLLHQHASIASPDSDLSADSQSAAISALYGPDNFRHEPFSVFYGTNGGAAASQLAAGIGTGAIGTPVIEQKKKDNNLALIRENYAYYL